MTHPIILAAGLGRRMRPLSGDLHKTMIPLFDDQTILSNILYSVAEAGFAAATIVTGYRSNEVREYAQAHSAGLALDFVENPRFETTNNIHSLSLAFEHVDVSEGIVLIESDLVFAPSVLARLLESPHPDVALVDRYRPGMDGTVVRLAADGHIERVVPSGQQGPDFDFQSHFKTLNVYRFSGDFCTGAFGRLLRFYSEEVSDNCFYELVLGMIVAAGQARIYGEVLSGEVWAEVDDPVDLQQARFMVDTAGRGKLLRESWGGYWGYGVRDFAFIRNMHFPTDSVIAELRMQLPELVHSYGSAQRIIDQKMSWFLEWPADSLVTLNGASQAFPLLATHFRDHDALLPNPTFGEWTRIFPHASLYGDDGSGFCPTVLPAGSVLVAVNPNNPTGSSFDTAEIVDTARRNADSHVIVDESFIDFSSQPSVLSLDPPPNLLVLKSLSKSLGMPGLRLGFLACPDTTLLEKLRSQIPIWNINSVAEKTLELLLKNREVVERSFESTVADRDDLNEALSTSPLVARTWPSSADFVLVELAMDSDRGAFLADRLISRHNILVKDVSDRWGDGVARWRIAVKTPRDHRELVRAMTVEGRT